MMKSKHQRELHPFNPGSDEAIYNGCICAVMDNHYGKGRYGDWKKYGFFITQGCPLHDQDN